MKKRRCLNIEDNIWKILDKIAKKENRSKSNMIEILIKRYKDE